MWQQRSDCHWLRLYAKEAWQDHSRSLLASVKRDTEALLTAQTAILALSDITQGGDKRERLQREHRDFDHAVSTLVAIMRNESTLLGDVKRTSADFVEKCSFPPADVEANLLNYDPFVEPPDVHPWLSREPG